VNKNTQETLSYWKHLLHSTMPSSRGTRSGRDLPPNSGYVLGDPPAPLATLADERCEYKTTRRLETRTTKNTEKRVQRQVVLGDGRVLARAEPQVTVDKVEDFRTHERENVDEDDADSAYLIGPSMYSTAKKRAGDVVDETLKRTVNTRDVREDVKTTSTPGARLVGRIRRKELDRALRDNLPLEDVVASRKEERRRRRKHEGIVVPAHADDAKPSVVYKASSRHRTVDAENVRTINRRGRDGRIHTETVRTEEHEETQDRDQPDEGTSGVTDVVHERDGQRFTHDRKVDFVDYVGPGGERLAGGPRAVVEERRAETGVRGWREEEERFRRNRREMRRALKGKWEESADTNSILDRLDELNRPD